MRKFILFVLLLVPFLVGCAVGVESDNPSANYNALEVGEVPNDTTIYKFYGTVDLDAYSLVRQTAPAEGSLTAVGGVAVGSYEGASIEGKSFLRILVSSVSPTPPGNSTVGHVVIFKFTDTKALRLLIGDEVYFKCRRQYEAIAPLGYGEDLDVEAAAAFEFDYCRLEDGILK